ncbi:MAG: hypothetical protein NUV53_03870 [Patescibacteria group bacterium]|nr:hypothetical protein [Patescibacteria group bacterium]
MEKRVCKNCKTEFSIFPDDLTFYEKIGVPSPTRCPECRYIRRLLDRNEYNFYRRKCDITGEDVISIYRSDAPFPVYTQEYWKSDKFDAIVYGQNFDFQKPFFEQYETLRRAVPHLALVNSRSVNSEYTNQSQDNKDCYMLVTSGSNEKCMYGSWNSNCFLCGDCYMIEKSESCYECINLKKCSHCAWLQNSSDCVNVYFSDDCRGCADCFGCVGLRSKQYYWFNTQLTKDEYEKRIKEFPWTRESMRRTQEEFARLRLAIPVKHYHGMQAQESSGDYLGNTQRARMAFNCRDNKDTAYMQDAWVTTEECRDCTEIIIGMGSYEIQGVETPHQSIVARSCFNSITDSYYCDMCFGVSDCFGCFGLKQKQYCILNKQYSKDEYIKLKTKIIEHMKELEEWGEYFPPEHSPFAYNESMAQDYFPLEREEALKKGYFWHDRPTTQYAITLTPDKLPKTIAETTDDVVNYTIQCNTQENNEEENSLCVGAFRLIPLEITLYRKLGVPIPEYCFPCRRVKRFKFRNPRKLWHRRCMCAPTETLMKADVGNGYKNTATHFHGDNPCPNEFETSYAPERKEIVYCEACYQAEVA